MVFCCFFCNFFVVFAVFVGFGVGTTFRFAFCGTVSALVVLGEAIFGGAAVGLTEDGFDTALVSGDGRFFGFPDGSLLRGDCVG